MPNHGETSKFRLSHLACSFCRDDAVTLTKVLVSFYVLRNLKDVLAKEKISNPEELLPFNGQIVEDGDNKFPRKFRDIGVQGGDDERLFNLVCDPETSTVLP